MSEIPASIRKDLKLYHGPKDPGGAPTYNLYDPLSAKYYKIGWEESHIYKLAKPGMTYSEIADLVNKNSTLQLQEEEVQAFYQQLAHLGLLDLPKTSEQILNAFEKKKDNTVWWVLMHYLYFRAPLFKPDHFLEKTIKYAKLFWSKAAISFYVFSTIFGLLAVLTHWDEYFHTFTYFFNWEGALMYAATIWCLKVVHEFSHAYTAKNYHIHVPSMGVAIIVLWPVLYTDVTDSWKLSNRKERLAISIAGVTSELVIAGLSTFGWAISPPGILQSIFFLLSSTTWISSLFINFNPAMRFDGYYILSDLWGIDNLRQRSFAVAQWKWHEWLFGFGLPCPEENLSQSRIRGMSIYSFFTWGYLLTVYTLIALFVYYEFAKALGIVLFFLEIALFFVWPFVTEMKALYRLRSHFRLNFRTLLTLALTAALLFWLIIPLPHHMKIPSITIPQEEQILYVAEEGIIDQIFLKQGDPVSPGELIIQIRQEKLAKEIGKKMQEKRLLERLIEISALELDQNAIIPEKRAELLALVDELQGLEATREYLDIKGRIFGTLFTLDDTLQINQTVGKNQVLGKVADLNKVNVIAFVPERMFQDIHAGQKVIFTLPYSSRQYEGTVNYIESTPVKTLDYPTLGSKYKGPLGVTIDRVNNTLQLVDSYFKAKITLENPKDLVFGQIGSTSLQTPPKSLLMRGLEYLYSIFVQESAL